MDTTAPSASEPPSNANGDTSEGGGPPPVPPVSSAGSGEADEPSAAAETGKASEGVDASAMDVDSGAADGAGQTESAANSQCSAT
jgi:hypothetical protein